MKNHSKIDTSILSSTPTQGQVDAWHALTSDDQIDTLDAALQEGIESGESTLTVKNIFEKAFGKPFPLNG